MGDGGGAMMRKMLKMGVWKERIKLLCFVMDLSLKETVAKLFNIV